MTVRASVLHLVPSPSAEAPDTIALRRVARGDLTGLGELYDRYSVHLLRFTARAAPKQEAEDLVQSIFMKVVRCAAAYDGRAESARAWLFGIAARLIQERHRAWVRLTRALTTAAQMAEVPQGAAVYVASASSDLERGLEALSAPKRVVIVLAEIEGYTCEEIAEMLEIPVGTVWTRLHHARKELRSFYASEVR
jgi:RNA polymerase sigma-70 factor (ECF subfamily)